MRTKPKPPKRRPPKKGAAGSRSRAKPAATKTKQQACLDLLPECAQRGGAAARNFARCKNRWQPNWTNDPDASIELEEFLEQALTAANDKARELGWIV